MSAKKNSRLWAQLRLLCCSGLDLMSIAPQAFSVIRELVPSEAGALCLTDEHGTPTAFFHENAPVEQRELFFREPRLFAGPNEISVFNLVARPARKIGQVLTLPDSYWHSNTYQLLNRPQGHHQFLDGILDVDGKRAGIVLLFRGEGAPFSDDDVDSMVRIVRHFEHVLQAGRISGAEGGNTNAPMREALVVARVDGTPVFASPAALDMLMSLPQMGVQWPDRRRLPLFCQHLITVLRAGEAFPLTLPHTVVPAPGGELQASAEWLMPQGGSIADPLAAVDGQMVAIRFAYRRPIELRIWNKLRGARLSPQQTEVAFWMGMGRRNAVRANMSISDAVLNDCLKVLYSRLGCSTQDELAELLRAA